MAKQMKTVHAPRSDEIVLVGRIDLLKVARGHRVTKRGGVHKTARKPSRAQAKRKLRRELAGGAVSDRGRMR